MICLSSAKSSLSGSVSGYVAYFCRHFGTHTELYWDGAVPYQTVEIPSIDAPNTFLETYNDVLLKKIFIPGKASVPYSLDYAFDQLKDPNAYNPERAAKLLDIGKQFVEYILVHKSSANSSSLLAGRARL